MDDELFEFCFVAVYELFEFFFVVVYELFEFFFVTVFRHYLCRVRMG